MSTRSVIARKTESGFEGVYHHWDGYPSGVGRTLFRALRDYWKGDLASMLRYIIDEHSSWSSINQGDFSLDAVDRDSLACTICQRGQWAHYRQYYGEHSETWKDHGRPPVPRPDRIIQFDHGFSAPNLPSGPDGTKKKNQEDDMPRMTEKNASGSGCEYAYVFDEQARTMDILSSHYADGSGKAIGMFGMGDPEAKWRHICTVFLHDAGLADEPNWDELDRRAAANFAGMMKSAADIDSAVGIMNPYPEE